MADGAKETPAAVRGRTWHRGDSDWEWEALANQGSTTRDCCSGGGGSGRRGSGEAGLEDRCGSGSGLLWRVAANAGHGRGLSVLGRLRRRCERNGMKMRRGGGGGGGGGTFYKSVWQLKGPQGSRRAMEDKFLYYCEIYACTSFHPAK